MVRTKVFVGNLSFKTKEPELKAHFSGAGNVINVNIITRGPRSLGYGFVEMESEEAANAAIQALHHKEVDGRQINVELVKEPKEGEEVPKKERKPREPRQPKSPATGSDSKDEADAPREAKTRRPRKPSTKKAEGENVKEGTKAEKPARDPKQPREPRPERTDKPREPREPRAEKPREPREPRPKKSTENRTESETLLFVANLPFSLDNDAFSEFVTKQGVQHKTAYVVKKHNNRSKGYGFIELNNQAEQKAAFDKLNGITIEDRALSVKIALTPPAGSEETQEKQQEKPAPAQGSQPSGNVSSPKPVTPNTNKEQGVKSPKPEGTPAAASPKKEVKKEGEKK
eukprot:TRINITY_DN14882_c1_g1_i1.p1 TRINITY_DN14882_c1_g1~~TRINITY_DN14882_c1_g1_i1.p1  ORF type:complete len:343 (-),score=134.61 TRINITY_DN14882_c1_g1_i1:125-1153(-)